MALPVKTSPDYVAKSKKPYKIQLLDVLSRIRVACCCCSDFPTNQTFHQFHDLNTELDLHRLWVIMSGFHGAFSTDVACQQGTLTLPDTSFRPPSWDLLVLQLLRPDSSKLPCLYSTFHLEYPLVLSRFCLQYLSLAIQFPFDAVSLKISPLSVVLFLWYSNITIICHFYVFEEGDYIIEFFC